MLRCGQLQRTIWTATHGNVSCSAQTMLMKPKPLTLAGVYASLRTIATTKGAGSAQRKQDLIKQMVSRCRCVSLATSKAQLLAVCGFNHISKLGAAQAGTH